MTFKQMRGMAVLGAAALMVVGGAAFGRQLPLPGTSEDFSLYGTQPLDYVSEFYSSYGLCSICHAGWNMQQEPFRWAGSLHAHAARDPLFRAAVAVANQDVSHSGETCWRCHSPRGWLEGRVVGHPDGSMLDAQDIQEGVSCHFCHRMVDPVYTPGVSPPEDFEIIEELELAGLLPTSPDSGQYVMEPYDRRRGPYTYDPQVFEPPHPWIQSHFHRSGDMCGTCHDVSNPALSRVGNGVYAPNAWDEPHPTMDKYDMFPEQRTYSEWLASAYPQGFDTGGRFGGNNPVVSQCQDCHMPRHTGPGCQPYFEGPIHNDLPYHSFQGANRWMIDVLLHLYSNEFDADTLAALDAAKTDTEEMLTKATDMVLEQLPGGRLKVRIINECGHKLLTGYPEGRRIWLNVKFFDGNGGLIAERGRYDAANATLVESDTKVYEVKHGLDGNMASLTGVAEGPSFHLVLNNKIYKDNRIPPRGYTQAGFQAVQSEPVGYHYEDGQHWDDTCFSIPSGTETIEVTLYYQTASRQYIEFLRDEDARVPPGTAGQLIYDAWVATGKSPPFAMDNGTFEVLPFTVGDMDGDLDVDSTDLNIVLTAFGCTGPGMCAGDADCDGDTDSTDLNIVLTNFGA